MSHLACELGFDVAVAGELDRDGVAAAQSSGEVHGLLWWRRQSSEQQVVVEVAQIVTL